MQTFLPYPSFSESARTLDRQRLGKQRVEAYQILRMLVGETDGGGWRKHPAVLMWKGYEAALAEYGITMCDMWRARGYEDNMRQRFCEIVARYGLYRYEDPPWLGDEKIHRSHRSNLVSKKPEHYAPIFTDVSMTVTIPYEWPVRA